MQSSTSAKAPWTIPGAGCAPVLLRQGVRILAPVSRPAAAGQASPRPGASPRLASPWSPASPGMLLHRRRRRVLAPPLAPFKTGEGPLEEGEPQEGKAPAGGSSSSSQGPMDEKQRLDGELEAERRAVTPEPSQIQTPAAGAQRGPLSGAVSALLAPLAWAVNLPSQLAAWAVFQAQKLMTGPLVSKLASYFVVGMPLVLGFAVLYSWASGKPLSAGLTQAWGNLYKVPGTTVLGDVNLLATAINILTFFLGTFTFALILGVITEEVGSRYQAVRQGNYPVQAVGHTLVLNWNPQLVPVLRQMGVAREERGAFEGPVVVLAERDKQGMDSELGSALGPSWELITRKGPPTSTLYLDRAAAALASTVLVLAPESGPGVEGQDCAAEKQVASLLALQALREAAKRSLGGDVLPPQTVIVQSPPQASAPPGNGASSPAGSMGSVGSMDSAGSSGSAGSAGSFSTSLSPSGISGGGSGAHCAAHPAMDAARSLMARSAQGVEFADVDLAGAMANVMAQSAVQPGVASVYCSLVQQTKGGAELYIRRFPELCELSYGEARRRVRGAVPIGYIAQGVSPDVRGFQQEKAAQAQGAGLTLHGERWPHVHLNPPDDDIILDNCALILVAQEGRAIKPLGWEPQEFVLARQMEEGTRPSPPSTAPRSWRPPQKPRHVFVLEWGSDGESPPSRQVTQLVSHLQSWLPEDSVVTVVGPCAPQVDCSIDSDAGSGQGLSNLPHDMHAFEGGVTDRSIMQSQDAEAEAAARREARQRGRQVKTVHLQHRPTAAGGTDLRRVIEDAGLADADAVAVLSSSNKTDDGGAEADAHTVAALALLEDVLAEGGRAAAGRPPLHVLGSVHRPETVQVANHLMGKLGTPALTAELLQPDELAAGVLVQLAAEPLLGHVLRALLSGNRGPAIHMSTLARYGVPEGELLSFATVAELVRAGGGTAIGYISGAGQLILAPPAGEERSFSASDRLVVLA